jgi:hypothetical protein
MGEERNSCSVLVVKAKGNRTLEKSKTDGRIIIKLILWKLFRWE